MSNNINNPHDKMFRASMNSPMVAKEFLEAHLPDVIKDKIDWQSIITCPNTFIDEELKLTQSDVLLQVKISGSNAYIYILAEHQSKADPIMPFRLLKYMVKIWDYHQAKHKSKNNLPFPVIVPMVFYTGKNIYNAPRSIWELCGSQADLMKNILNQPFCLVDLSQAVAEELIARPWSGTMEFIMRHRFRQHLSQELALIADNINRLLLVDKSQFVLQLLSYMLAIDEEHHSASELIALIQNKLAPQAGDEIMSLAEILKEEGRKNGIQEGMQEGMQKGMQKGIEKGILEVAKKLLEAGTDPVFVAKNTGLSLDKVKHLQKTIKQ
jgi:predicted transposase/invertase (TIGR01784 family)